MARKRDRTWLWLVVVLPIILGGSMLLFHAMQSASGAEKTRLEHLVRRSTFDVLDNLNLELFTMYSSLSLDLYPVKAMMDELSLADISEAAQQYKERARFPGLLNDLVCVVLGPHGQLEYYWHIDSAWHQLDRPAWIPALHYPGDFPSRKPSLPAAWTTGMISLDNPVMAAVFRQPNKQPGSILAVALRFNVEELETVVVPSLVRQAFGEGATADAYLATIDHGPGNRNPPGRVVDLRVPLFPTSSFDSWLDHYLSRMRNLYAAGIAPDLPQQASIETWGGQENGDGQANGSSGWLMSVTLLPDGIDAHLGLLRWRNLGVSALFFGLLTSGFLAVFFSALRTRRAAERERDFLALVSHELKTPLATIRSLSDNLAGGVVSQPAAIAEYGQLIREESLRLGRMVHNILGLATVGNQPEGLKLQALDLGELCATVIQRHQLDASALDVRLHLVLPKQAPVVISNGPFLSAALDNLVSNAIHHGRTSSGPSEVLIDIQSSRRFLRRGVRIRVQDKGHGIPWRERRRIFKPFQKGREAFDEQHPGSGVGLSLVKGNLQSLGGKIRVGRASGGGASFSIWLGA